MYQEVLRSVEGVGIFPTISLVVFIIVFALVVVYAAWLDRAGVEKMAGLPLDNEEDAQ
jgi:cytochrome c oxidase cbb3-type subunit 3